MIGANLIKVKAFARVEESWKANEVKHIEKSQSNIVQARGWKKLANGEIKVKVLGTA